jgi:hypothetical protein
LSRDSRRQPSAFNLKGLNGFSVEFKKDASGKFSEMLVVQPEGPAVAKKKL